MGKPITLTSVRFYDSKGKFIVGDNTMVSFGDIGKADVYIEALHRFYELMYKMELVISPDRNETIEEIDIHKVFGMTGDYFKIQDVLGRTRVPFVIEARRYGIMICIERGLKPVAICRAIGYDHATISHHQKKFSGFCETEKGYHDRFLEVQDYVLTKLSGRFKEDGSGEKLK